jgi:hypothetical protein
VEPRVVNWSLVTKGEKGLSLIFNNFLIWSSIHFHLQIKQSCLPKLLKPSYLNYILSFLAHQPFLHSVFASFCSNNIMSKKKKYVLEMESWLQNCLSLLIWITFESPRTPTLLYSVFATMLCQQRKKKCLGDGNLAAKSSLVLFLFLLLFLYITVVSFLLIYNQ